MNLGAAIQKLRDDRGILAKDLARRAKVTPSYLCHVEGGRRVPAFHVLERIAAALDIPTFLLVMLATEKSVLDAMPLEQRRMIGDRFMGSK